MTPLSHYLILSAILFSIGTAGVFMRRNLITILLSIEIMLNAVNLSFVAFGRQFGNLDGQIIVTTDGHTVWTRTFTGRRYRVSAPWAADR